MSVTEDLQQAHSLAESVDPGSLQALSVMYGLRQAVAAERVALAIERVVKAIERATGDEA